MRGAWGAQGHLASGSQLILRGGTGVLWLRFSCRFLLPAHNLFSISTPSIDYVFQLWDFLVFLDGNKGRHAPCGAAARRRVIGAARRQVSILDSEIMGTSSTTTIAIIIIISLSLIITTTTTEDPGNSGQKRGSVPYLVPDFSLNARGFRTKASTP